MNLRDWARATQRHLASESEGERARDLSMAEVERVLRGAIDTLVEALHSSDDLRLDDLGRLWVEEKPARVVVSNLSRRPQRITLAARRSVRYRVSKKLMAQLNPPPNSDQP